MRGKGFGQRVESLHGKEIAMVKESFFREIDQLNSLKSLDPGKINEFADKLGGLIHHDIATSQLRRVYGEIKRLQRGATFDAKGLDIFTPRLAFASARKPELETIYEVFKRCRPKITNKDKEDLNKFVFIIEALVAYHKYHEEKHKRGR